MPNLTKTPSSGAKPAVRQVKGPGMNRGLFKRHKMAAPKPYKPSRAQKKAEAGVSGSLLPSGMFANGGKVQAMSSGKGKAISCKNY